MVSDFNRYYSQPRRLSWNRYNSFSQQSSSFDDPNANSGRVSGSNQIGDTGQMDFSNQIGTNSYPVYEMDPSLGKMVTSYNNMYVGVPIRLKNWRDSYSFSTGQAFTSTGHYCQVYCAKSFGRRAGCKYQFCYV